LQLWQRVYDLVAVWSRSGFVSAGQTKLDATPLREDSATLSDRVAIDLGTQIIHGELGPGERLPSEAELCELYRVSRSVIRDAIRTLSGRGLIDVRQGHGMLVTQPTDAPFAQALIVLLMRSDLTIADVREGRAQIETQLAPLAATRGLDSDWDAMESSLAIYADAVSRRAWDEARDAHLAFHCALLEAIRLPSLTIILKPMQQVILLCSLPPQISGKELSRVWTDSDVQIHRPVLAALRSHDPEAVHAAMAAQFVPSLNRERDQFKSFWQLPFRDSPMGQVLLREFLSAKPVPDANR
jgi:GntR family transcriptional regulator, transcriptional repressor for pyruvate dehydrogenase complex